MPAHVYRILSRQEWERVKTSEFYTPKELQEDGFVHLSCWEQVVEVANFICPGHSDMVLLQISTARLQAALRLEDLYGYQQDFPHLYGPLNLSAINAVWPLEWQADTFVLPDPSPAAQQLVLDQRQGLTQEEP